MTERPQDQPRPRTPAPDDRTRDIRLPAMPDRPPPAMPRAWAGITDRPAQAPGTAADTTERPPRPPGAVPLVDQPTDELGRPGAQPRERTLVFSSPEMSQRPAGPVQVTRTPRRWPWVLMTLLPVLIIAGTGIALLLLLLDA